MNRRSFFTMGAAALSRLNPKLDFRKRIFVRIERPAIYVALFNESGKEVSGKGYSRALLPRKGDAVFANASDSDWGVVTHVGFCRDAWRTQPFHFVPLIVPKNVLARDTAIFQIKKGEQL